MPACHCLPPVELPATRDSEQRDVHQSLTPENGLDRGFWGVVEICPDGDTVHSFEIKVIGQAMQRLLINFVLILNITEEMTHAELGTNKKKII